METVRRLIPADLEQCLDVAASVGWQRERTKWRLLLSLGKGFGVESPQESPEGRLVGTAIATRLGALAAIGLVLVDPRFGRRGLGTQLVHAALKAEPDALPFLFATEQGRPLYEKLGFRAIGTIAKHVGRFQGPPPSTPLRPATLADLPALERLDTEALGVPRGRMLEPFLREGAGGLVALGPAGQPIGFGFSWDNETLRMLGPIVADGERTARDLLCGLAEGVAGTVRVDIPENQPGFRAFAKSVGLSPLPESPLMTLGGAPLPGERTRLFAIAAKALG
jgi:GNAT superfamily N-acetyltransferase